MKHHNPPSLYSGTCYSSLAQNDRYLKNDHLSGTGGMDMCEKKDFNEVTLARKCGRMARLIHEYYRANAKEHGASSPLRGQGRVLALLSAKPETTQRELSYVLDMRPQSLSELLFKLEEKGYITREKSETDARVTVVKLTEAGAAAAPDTDDINRQADALSCLTDEERDQLEAIVDKVNTSLVTRLVELGVDPRGHKPHGHGPHKGPHCGPMPGPKPAPFHGPAGDCGPHGMKRGPWIEPDGGCDNTLRA